MTTDKRINWFIFKNKDLRWKIKSPIRDIREIRGESFLKI